MVPAQIPARQPARFELALNQAASRPTGIRFQQTVLLRAYRVIE